MEQNNSQINSAESEDKYGSDVKMSSPLLKKLDNFWYHYKWHTIFILIGIFTVLICVLQLCSKQSYDVHLLYAGYYHIDRTQPEDGSLPEYNTILSSVKRAGEDFDGNGEITVSFATHQVMSEARREELELQTGEYISESLLSSDRQTLYDRMLYSEYYLCLLSVEVYNDCMNKFDGAMGGNGLFFVNLEQFLPEGAEVEYYGEYKNAIMLSSLELYKLAGVCDLPEDTVLCLRFRSGLTSVIDEKESEEYYRRSIEVLKNILEAE